MKVIKHTNLESTTSSQGMKRISTEDENVPLISRPSFSTFKYRYKNTRSCIRSKAALTVMIWTFLLPFAYLVLRSPELLQLKFLEETSSYRIYPTKLLLLVVQCFFPLAGHLAETRIGRFNTIYASLWATVPGIVVTFLGAEFVFLTSQGVVASTAASIAMTVIGAILIVAGFSLLIIGNAGYSANVIQFGLDQLYDAPAEDQSLFIHWYIWANSAAELVISVISSSLYFAATTQRMITSRTLLFSVMPAMLTFTLVITLCVAYCKKRWFLIEPKRINMYNLVFKVTKFASQHKAPIRRSAFTYCEDELPTGLDLGKRKYGGPFTIEQVEDVKAFYGILKVLLTLGVTVFTQTSVDILQYSFKHHFIFSTTNYSQITNESNYSTENATTGSYAGDVFLNSGIIYSLVTFLCIPFFLFFIRPLIITSLPGMLKRIGLGMVITVFSAILNLVMDIIIESEMDAVGCSFIDKDGHNETFDFSKISVLIQLKQTTFYMPLFQQALSALSNMLISIATYEFICSQSPNSMKGVLIGLLYAVRGLASLVTYLFSIFFTIGWHTKLLPSCDVFYNTIILLVSLVALALYIFTAKRYKFRERDEPCHDYRYVDDYYYKLHQYRLKFNED